jgi:hypothetical protein
VLKLSTPLPSPQKGHGLTSLLSIVSHSELSKTHLRRPNFIFSLKQNQSPRDIKVQKKPTFNLSGVSRCKPYFNFASKFSKSNKQGVCHTLALPFTLKKYFKAKEELWKLKYSPYKNIIFKNIL